MATLTQGQLAAIEKDMTYQDYLRIAVMAQAGFWKQSPPQPTEEWFRKRQTAEKFLDQPAESFDRRYWASRSLQDIKNYDINGIGENSTAKEVAEAISDAQWEQLANYTFSEEAKRVLF